MDKPKISIVCEIKCNKLTLTVEEASELYTSLGRALGKNTSTWQPYTYPWNSWRPNLNVITTSDRTEFNAY